MTTSHSTPSAPLRRAVGIAATVAASVSILAAGMVNVGAESGPGPAPVALNQRQIAEVRAIAEWARSEGLTGLSPASLHPIDQRQVADLKAIADWARSEGLTGLSPASLRPIDPD